MQRFVYTPRIEVHIALSSTGKTIDVSDDIINGSVTRRLSAISQVDFILQNKNSKYIDVHPIQPMDKIIVKMSRVGQPFQVFAGFVDDAPFYQLYPGPIKVSASCTLKLLQHTYFDPGLPIMTALFRKYGWDYDPTSGRLTDGMGRGPNTPANRKGQGSFEGLDAYGGIGDVIAAVLTEKNLGNWPGDHVHIYDLPENFIKNIVSLRRAAIEELEDVLEEQEEWLRRLLKASGTASVRDSTGDGNTNVTAVQGSITPVEAAKAVLRAGFKGKTASGEDAAVTAVATAMAESNLKADVYNGICCWGIFQINIGPPGTAPNTPEGVHRGKTVAGIVITEESVKDPYANAKFAFQIYKDAGNYFSVPGTMNPWQAHGEGKHRRFLEQAANAVEQAKKEISGASPDDRALPKGTNTTKESTTQDGGRNENNPDPPYYPLAKRASSVGTPADHRARAMGNWQSDRAYDLMVPIGTACIAVETGTITQVKFQPTGAATATEAEIRGSFGGNPSGMSVYLTTDDGTQFWYTHMLKVTVREGQKVQAGDILGRSGSGNGVEHLHFAMDTASDGAIAMYVGRPTITGKLPDGYVGDDTGGDTGTGTDVDKEDPFALAMQSQFFALQLQSDSALSSVLTGKRAIANDISLLGWIETMVQASGREFTSLPNGDFLAFYPDRFGYFKRTPYFRISDIEVLDLNINKNDRELTTHMFATGHYATDDSTWNARFAAVASIEEEAFNYFVNVNPDKRFAKKDGTFDPMKFLRRYGARPMMVDTPQIRHPVLVWMYAWMQFTEQWAKQFQSTGSFTFMPELFPGGLVAFGDRITMFIEEVTHSFDMDGGFSTTASLTSPASLDESFDWMPLYQEGRMSGSPDADGVDRAPAGDFE